MNTTPQTSDSAPPMTRVEVTGLTALMPAYHGTTPREAELRWWRDALAGYTAAECQAAILAHVKTSKNVTPTDIIGRIREARQRTEARPGRKRDREAERAHHAAAGLRGIAKVYAAMGWQPNPTKVAARSVACPFCHARSGEVCSPLSRNRNGHHERRDSATYMHPSRIEAGLAAVNK